MHPAGTDSELPEACVLASGKKVVRQRPWYTFSSYPQAPFRLPAPSMPGPPASESQQHGQPVLLGNPWSPVLEVKGTFEMIKKLFLPDGARRGPMVAHTP